MPAGADSTRSERPEFDSALVVKDDEVAAAGLPTPAPSSACDSNSESATSSCDSSNIDDSDVPSDAAVILLTPPLPGPAVDGEDAEAGLESAPDASPNPVKHVVELEPASGETASNQPPVSDEPVISTLAEKALELHSISDPLTNVTGEEDKTEEDREEMETPIRRQSSRLRNNPNPVKSYNINVLDGSAKRRISLSTNADTGSPHGTKNPLGTGGASASGSNKQTDRDQPATRKSKRLETKAEENMKDSEPGKAKAKPSRRITLAVMEDLDEPKPTESRKSRRKSSRPLPVPEGDEPTNRKRRRVSKAQTADVGNITETSPDSKAPSDAPPAPSEKTETASEKATEYNPGPLKRPQQKMWQPHGIYAGQERMFEPDFEGKRSGQPKKLSEPYPESNYFPLPIFLGEMLIRKGRDFELPFHVMNILPEEVKPSDGWTLKRDSYPKSRYIGDAVREKPRIEKEQAFCACTLPGGCDDRCWNACVKIECDETNCNMPLDKCKNRVFSTKMTAPAGRRLNQFQIGLEVMKTPFKGHGVRAVRSFEPGEPIGEYTGDLITLDEAQRRQAEDYANMNNFYMMSIRKGLIVDATKRGSITRFVNHSCKPNCIMDLRVVKGVERVALFAGDDGIRTGEEITYDYDFSLFDGTAPPQKCFCGEPTCRGFIEKRARVRESRSAKEKGQVEAAVKEGLQKGKAGSKSKVAARPSSASSVISETVSAFMPVMREKQKAKFGLSTDYQREQKKSKSKRMSTGSIVSRKPSQKPEARKRSSLGTIEEAKADGATQGKQTPCENCSYQWNKKNDRIVFCDGCPRGYHQRCHDPVVPPEELEKDSDWYCSACVAGGAPKKGGNSAPETKSRGIEKATPTLQEPTQAPLIGDGNERPVAATKRQRQRLSLAGRPTGISKKAAPDRNGLNKSERADGLKMSSRPMGWKGTMGKTKE